MTPVLNNCVCLKEKQDHAQQIHKCSQKLTICFIHAFETSLMIQDGTFSFCNYLYAEFNKARARVSSVSMAILL